MIAIFKQKKIILNLILINYKLLMQELDYKQNQLKKKKLMYIFIKLKKKKFFLRLFPINNVIIRIAFVNF